MVYSFWSFAVLRYGWLSMCGGCKERPTFRLERNLAKMDRRSVSRESENQIDDAARRVPERRVHLFGESGRELVVKFCQASFKMGSSILVLQLVLRKSSPRWIPMVALHYE